MSSLPEPGLPLNLTINWLAVLPLTLPEKLCLPRRLLPAKLLMPFYLVQ
jgi:hypothetical protein